MNDSNFFADSKLNILLWIEELLPQDILMIPRFGGQAYYLDEHLILILVERAQTTREHKGETYPFDLWKGCIFPVEQMKQNAFFLKYLFLENHPVNKDWLYIPAESEHFEEEVKQMIREISRRNVLLGLRTKTPRTKKPKGTTAKPKKPKANKPDKKKENSFLLAVAGQKKN